jgi:hypothetical protein
VSKGRYDAVTACSIYKSIRYDALCSAANLINRTPRLWRVSDVGGDYPHEPRDARNPALPRAELSGMALPRSCL